MGRYLFTLLSFAVLLGLLVLPGIAAAEDTKTYYYGFINVGMAVQDNGDMRPKSCSMSSPTASFHHVFRTIDLIASITLAISVSSAGGQAYARSQARPRRLHVVAQRRRGAHRLVVPLYQQCLSHLHAHLYG